MIKSSNKNDNNLLDFLKKYWHILSILFAAVSFCTKQIYTLSDIEKDFIPLQDSVRKMYYENRRLSNDVNELKSESNYLDKRAKTDSVYLNDLFYYKYPFGIWGNLNR